MARNDNSITRNQRRPQQKTNQRNKRMKLKTQIVAIVLALTATTSPVWSQDRQALPSPTAHTLQGTWRVTITALSTFPAIMTFNQGGTCTGYVVVPGTDPGQGTEYGVWQREPGSHNYSDRTVSY